MLSDPMPGLDDTERPAWLDMGTLRFERTDGFLSGLMVGTCTGVLADVLLQLVLHLY